VRAPTPRRHGSGTSHPPGSRLEPADVDGDLARPRRRLRNVRDGFRCLRGSLPTRRETRRSVFDAAAASTDAASKQSNERRNEMGKIVISDNVTLDGVDQDPTGEEGFRHGGWFAQVGDNDREGFAKVALDEALGAEAFLFGRRRYEFLAARWPSRSGELADRLNSLPKYIVSSTLGDPDWNNSTVLKGEVVTEISKLKQELDGDIVVPGSRQLVRTLMEHDLIDELRLLVYPIVLGAGERLFGATSDKMRMRLLDARTVGDGLAYLTYEVVRAA
jgi:dihydrofolate reductase